MHASIATDSKINTNHIMMKEYKFSARGLYVLKFANFSGKMLGSEIQYVVPATREFTNATPKTRTNLAQTGTGEHESVSTEHAIVLKCNAKDILGITSN